MQIFHLIAEYFSYSFVRYAFIAGVLTALCSSLLGVTLVLKRYSFIGDGLSHVAFGAMAIAAILSVNNEMLIVMPVTVLCAGLLLAGGRHAKIKGDAALAMLSVGSMAIGYLLLSCFSIGEHNTLLRLARVDYNAVTGHHFGDWTVTTEATCTEPGVRTRTCTDAGCTETETEAIPALGHDWGEGVTVAEPSGAQGGRVRTTCKRCGAESLRFTDPEIPAYQQFDDVDFALWSYPGIAFCVKTGLMSGTDAHTFAPKGVTTRAQIVQILYNLAGEPAVTGMTPFTDLTNDWYQNAILWAYQTGVVAGTSATTFDPESPVTREQIAVILMGYADMVQHRDHTWPPADLSAFPDGADVSDWARDAVAEAVALGLISGAQTKDGTFLQPQGGATREQAATILMGFYSLVDVDLRMA